MPLNILKHKSWNPYGQAARERVRQDEAALAAAHAAYDALEAARTARQLRRNANINAALVAGHAVTSDENADEASLPDRETFVLDYVKQRRKAERTDQSSTQADEPRKKRRLPDEDESSYAIRLAAERRTADGLDGANDDAAEDRKGRRGNRSRPDENLSITDAQGHIQLFAPAAQDPRDRRQGRHGDRDRDRHQDRNARSADDAGAGHGMRLADAAGYSTTAASTPWYSSRPATQQERSGQTVQDREERAMGKDAFGRDDPQRTQRDAVRLTQADPLAVMQDAQRRLKIVQAERERVRREVEDEREGVHLERERGDRRQREERNHHGDHSHRHGHSRRHGHVHRHRHREDDGHDHGHRRHRRRSSSRSRSPVRNRDRDRDRSRSPARRHRERY